MMKYSNLRDMSLIEQKKLQWAKEKGNFNSFKIKLNRLVLGTKANIEHTHIIIKYFAFA